MRCARLVLILAIVHVAACGDSTDTPIQSGAVIALADGDLQGAVDGHSRRFLGIPFAKPPVGELRWRAPVKNDAWSGVRDATAFGGRCAQLMSLQSFASDSEDCLYLNVWVPEPAPTERLPVMVWFHGGGNETGSTSDLVPLGVGGLFYDGRALAERYGVVVVSTNYRLGPLGFFYHPKLAAEGSPQGNQGLLDQRRALEWVRDNIAPFGGDPDNVTIFGESAGSYDVCFHIASPGSAGLFHRAIGESGGCTTRVSTKAEREAGVAAFTEAMGCGDAADPLVCLRQKSPGDLLMAAPIDGAPPRVLPGGSFYQGGTARWSFGPVVDGAVLPDQPRLLFDRGQVAKVPYLLGSNTDEGTLFHVGSTPVITEAEYLAALERRFGASLAAQIAALYPTSSFATPNDALARVTGDAGLVCPTHDSARRAAAAGLTVRMYNFGVPIPILGLGALLGATHGAEIPFVFDSVDGPEQETVGEPLRGYWTRFAKTGDPNGDGALPWPAFEPDDDQRMNFGSELSVLTDFRGDECAFWRQLYDTQFQ